MFNQSADAKLILLRTKRYRVVATGKYGWKTELTIELAHTDAMGETSWHLLSQYELSNDGNACDMQGEDAALVEVLGQALKRVRELEGQLATAGRQLDTAKERISELEAAQAPSA